MTPNSNASVSVKELQKLYGSSPAATAIFDYFAGRKHGSADTTVDRLRVKLRQEGHDLPRRDIIKVLRALADAGCGDFIIGRRGRPSRLEWTVNLVSIGQAAAGEATHVEEITEAEKGQSDDPEGAELDHKFLLRPDFEASIRLPADLAQHEALRLAEFIKALPFGPT